MGKGIMLQGTASSVGKSILAVALCRILANKGYEVAPFKSQNMSLNSFITPEGDEIGRAQAMQAEACHKAASVEMNPILLKPTSDRRSQVIFKGKVHKTMDAVDYFAYKPALRDEIQSVYKGLEAKNDVVVIEGAGSPAEINLKDNDIVNMGMAEMADAPVLLIGDIDKGGVFASLAGTLMLLTEEERKRVKGLIINKFRGSVEILEPGLKQIEEIVGVPVVGVVPYFRLDLEEEDSAVDFKTFHKAGGELDVAIIKVPYMSNFTDFNALTMYEDISVRFVDLKEDLGHPDVVVLPGTKTTIHDMKALHESGMAKQIHSAKEQGSFIFGICGGYQMLGEEIFDAENVETTEERTSGLGLIPMKTVFKAEKRTTQAKGLEKIYGTKVEGYEIHMGLSEWSQDETLTSFMEIKEENGDPVNMPEGAFSKDRKIAGTYLHGIFDNSQFTRAYFNDVRKAKGLSPIDEAPVNFVEYKNQQYDELARIVEESLDMESIYRIIEEGHHV